MLTIIGLIIGGILVGRDLIRVSELNSVVSEAGHYTQAVTDFRAKYLALPGDFAGATALWGSPAAGCPNGATAAGDPVTATCNGDGNGSISSIDGGGAFDGNNFYESIRAWQHLANAGLIDGSYTGVPGSALATLPVIGVNVPASKLAGAGYTIATANTYIANISPWFVGTYPHILFLGSVPTYRLTPFNNTWITFGPTLTPTEAYNIDAKVDDGMPGTGLVRTF